MSKPRCYNDKEYTNGVFTDPITYEETPESGIVEIDGFCFNALNLLKSFKASGRKRNPYTNLPFKPRQIEKIYTVARSAAYFPQFYHYNGMIFDNIDDLGNVRFGVIPFADDSEIYDLLFPDE